MRRTKKGMVERSERETYRTPKVAIDALVRDWFPLPGSDIGGIVDLCAGDGRIGSAISLAIDAPWAGCDIAPRHPNVAQCDVFQFVSENAELRWQYPDSGGQLYVMDPPYGMERDDRGLYLHDRIIEHVCRNWQQGDELLVLYPDLMYASERRQRHWREIGLGDPLIHYRLSFRCPFERDDGTLCKAAMSSVSWWRWANISKKTKDNLRLSDLRANGASMTLRK